MVVRALTLLTFCSLLISSLLLYQHNAAAFDGDDNSKILGIVKSYQSALERGDIKSLLDNFTKTQRELMQLCLADKQCAAGLSEEVLFVKLKDFKTGEIKDSKDSPGKYVAYSATRIFGSPERASEQSGSGEFFLVQEADNWKIAKVSWNPVMHMSPSDR